MQKITAISLAAVAFMVFTSAACFIGNGSLGEKHTGPITVRSAEEGWSGRLEFIRANGEIFEMAFDPSYEGPHIQRGDELSDLTYTDTKDHHQFFVKATLLPRSKDAAPLPDRVVYYSSGNMQCAGEGCAVHPLFSASLYRWKDGAFREYPEPEKHKHARGER